MGYCRADGQTGGWGYTGHEWDWLYYGSYYDDHLPHDHELANIPQPTIQCDVGYRPVMYVRTSDNWVAREWCELLPQPPHTLLPLEVDAWWDVAGMFFGWLLGVGPDFTVYKSGSIQVYQMQSAVGIQGGRNAWYEKNYYHIAFEGCQNLEGLWGFDVRFGLQGLRDAGNNATQQFVGSYELDIIPNADGTATFVASNITSMTSLLYQLDGAQSYSRETFPPGGNSTQVYTWVERMCGQDQ
jgi:hypothetical protein